MRHGDLEFHCHMFSTFFQKLWDQTLTHERPVSPMLRFPDEPRPLDAVRWNVSAWLREELRHNTVAYGTWTEHTSISMTITGRSPVNTCEHVCRVVCGVGFGDPVYIAQDDMQYRQAKLGATCGKFLFECTVTCYVCAGDATVVSLRLERRPERGALDGLLPQRRLPADTGMDLA